MKIKARYSVIDNMTARIREFFPEEDSRVAKVFENCISNTLQKTIHVQEDGSVYVITGDIPAMWLRDSACQLLPFLRFAKEEPEIRKILVKLVEKQMSCILLDPYANAFSVSADASGWMEDKTDMKPELWERKYEIDSLCHPVKLAWKLWKETGTTEHFTSEWKSAAKKIIETFRTEQDHEGSSPYRFERKNCVFTDTLSREGKGALVKSNIGLIWSGFRPSDDACAYGYFIPANMFASVILGHISEIAENVYGDLELAKEAAAFSKEVRDAIEKYAVIPCSEKDYYAYEVDGFGQYLVMDDANIPSLLSMPFLGWCDKEEEKYLNTRAVVLSEQNPYYYKGKYLCGVGSPHTPAGYVWDIAVAVQGLTSSDREEQYNCIKMMVENDAGTGLMHEGVYADDPSHYTRPWFSWANSMFCELVMDYCGL